ncbi:hypothetical protein [Flavobacterium xinjiangense]|uniref:hypothetical protein n=1 Tax=Flavobacterium xinjiangense TaxID=178356 RepID=UPI000933B380|nr:hypothetical protein [Flavobacterium xinjiangense]
MATFASEWVAYFVAESWRPLQRNIQKYNVPQKDGSTKEELAMDWTIYQLIKSPEDIRSAFSKHNKEINEDVEIKIQNTIKFFNEVKR